VFIRARPSAPIQFSKSQGAKLLLDLGSTLSLDGGTTLLLDSSSTLDGVLDELSVTDGTLDELPSVDCTLDELSSVDRTLDEDPCSETFFPSTVSVFVGTPESLTTESFGVSDGLSHSQDSLESEPKSQATTANVAESNAKGSAFLKTRLLFIFIVDSSTFVPINIHKKKWLT
jgi:hypothetical protein